MLVALATTTLTELGATVVVVVVAPPWCPDLVVVVVVVAPPPAAAVVDVVVEPPAPAVVVEVVAAVLGTLGRVPTATSKATATTKMAMTTAARGRESEPEDPGDGCSPSIGGPACRATPAKASLSAGRTEDGPNRPVT